MHQFTAYSILFVALIWAVFATRVQAESDVAATCDRVAQQVSGESGVPIDVLRAISLTETGRNRDGALQPWPWTVNMEGIGKWFDDRASAQAYVDRHFARGARSFDVGCFQINYKWHGQAFSSVEEMFDPVANARYAARFLSELFDEFNDWSKAAGAYHSRTPKFARKYTARFDRIRSRLSPLPETVPVLAQAPIPQTVRENRFPLLQRSSARASLASLVPLADDDAPRVIDLVQLRPIALTD